jgi:hypothetical protein
MPGEKKHKEGGASGSGKKKKDKGAAQQLPEHLEKQRRYVICGHDKNYHVRGRRRPPPRRRAAHRRSARRRRPPPGVAAPPSRRARPGGQPSALGQSQRAPGGRRAGALRPQTSTATSASEYLPVGVDNAWDFGDWAADMSIRVNSVSEDVRTAHEEGEGARVCGRGPGPCVRIARCWPQRTGFCAAVKRGRYR